MGIRRAGLLADEEEKRATAIHEIGHAMICSITEGAMPLYKVTIMPSGQSLGHVRPLTNCVLTILDCHGSRKGHVDSDKEKY
jgi:ATP-dependent Zn protease